MSAAVGKTTVDTVVWDFGAVLFRWRPRVLLAASLPTLMREEFDGGPVRRLRRQVVTDGRVDAVVLNSGGANACTGAQGFLDTHRTAELVAEAAGVSAGDVVVCSTGLIGELLPMDRIENGVTQLSGAVSADGGADGGRHHDAGQ